jgi:hypothetical protein
VISPERTPDNNGCGMTAFRDGSTPGRFLISVMRALQVDQSSGFGDIEGINATTFRTMELSWSFPSSRVTEQYFAVSLNARAAFRARINVLQILNTMTVFRVSD